MNAEEAKKLATARAKVVERRRAKKEKKECAEIMRGIKEIANNGYFSYTFNDLLYDDTVKYLRDLGYKVTEGIGYTRIEWD